MIRFVRMRDGVPAPERKTTGSAGYDLRAAHDTVIPPRGRALVMTGWGWCASEHNNRYGRVSSRSGLSVRHGIEVGAGVIDSDYQGEIGVMIYNHGAEQFNVHAGDRIAQLVVEVCVVDPVEIADYHEVATVRGAGGFGSTGVA